MSRIPRSLMLFLSSIVMSCFVCHALCVTGCDLSASAVLYAHEAPAMVRVECRYVNGSLAQVWGTRAERASERLSELARGARPLR